jgi:hypothetical protein
MIEYSLIEERIGAFKRDLFELEEEEIIQKCFQHNMEPVCISNDTYFLLKSKISKHFGLHPIDVFMVGSGKLGFTIKPNEQFRQFGDSSDIDIAIVSEELFERFWKAVYLYKNEVKYWPKEERFKNYLLSGWIRPDLLPPAKRFSEAQEWWDFFRNLTASGEFGPYKISAGLYYSRFFFESYQKKCITLCKEIIYRESGFLEDVSNK